MWIASLRQLKLIRAFIYKVIVQYQFHLDVVLISILPCGSTDQASNLTRCLVGAMLHRPSWAENGKSRKLHRLLRLEQNCAYVFHRTAPDLVEHFVCSLLNSRDLIGAYIGSYCITMWFWNRREIKLLRDLFLGENLRVLDRLVEYQDLT